LSGIKPKLVGRHSILDALLFFFFIIRAGAFITGHTTAFADFLFIGFSVFFRPTTATFTHIFYLLIILKFFRPRLYYIQN